MKLFTSSNPIAKRIFALSLCSLIAPMAYAQGDDDRESDQDGYFDEIIVSAEKKEESVLDTPMTITGFNEAMLQDFGIQDRDKLQIMVPGLQFGETTDQVGNGTSLRGIGTRNAGIDHGDRSVATYIDGAYTIGTYGTAPGGGFDLERVEVARGPQGTLNGRNAVAGSINYVYKKPSQEWEMDVMAQVNDVVQQRLNLAVGGPITDKLSFRATGGVHTGDGYQENVGEGDDMGAPDQRFYAGQLRFQTEKFDSNIRISRVTDQGTPSGHIAGANLNTTDPEIALVGAYSIGNAPPFTLATDTNTHYLYATQNPSGPADCPVGVPYQNCGGYENKVAANRTGFLDSAADMLNFYMEYDFTDSVSLRYTYADNDVAQYSFRDGDYTNRVPGITPSQSADGGVPYLDRAYEVTYDYDEQSHELLLTWDVNEKLDLIVGAFMYESVVDFQLTRNQFSHDWRFINSDDAAAQFGIDNGLANVTNCRTFVDNYLGAVFGLPVTPDFAGSFYFCPEDFPGLGRTYGDLTALVPFATGSENETEAVFFNADYAFNDTWKVSGGLRYLKDTKNQPLEKFFGSFMFNFLGVPTVVGFNGGGLDQPDSWDNVVGQLTLEYRTENDNLIYGRLSTGHKPGVFNFASPPVPGVPTTVEESTLINYEAGYKGTVLDGRLQIAAGAFYMDYDKMHWAATQNLAGSVQPNPNATSPLFEFIAAIPDSKVYGLEFEYQYAFSDRTSLFGYYAYTDSEIGPHESVVLGDPNAEYELYDYIDFDTGLPAQNWYELPQDQTGNQLPAQSNHKSATSLLHERDMANGGSLDFLVTWAFTGSQYPTIANIELYKMPSYNRWDASVMYTAPDENWSARFYVNNIGDKIGLNEFTASGGFGGQVFLASPTNHREFGLTVRWSPDL